MKIRLREKGEERERERAWSVKILCRREESPHPPRVMNPRCRFRAWKHSEILINIATLAGLDPPAHCSPVCVNNGRSEDSPTRIEKRRFLERAEGVGEPRTIPWFPRRCFPGIPIPRPLTLATTRNPINFPPPRVRGILANRKFTHFYTLREKRK